MDCLHKSIKTMKLASIAETSKTSKNEAALQLVFDNGHGEGLTRIMD